MDKFRESAIMIVFPFLEKEFENSFPESVEISQLNADNLKAFLEMDAYWEDDARGNTLSGRKIVGFDKEGQYLFYQNPGPEEEPIGLDEILLGRKNNLDSIRFLLITEFDKRSDGEGTLLIINDEARGHIMTHLMEKMEKEVKKVAEELGK